jgi:carbon storage regulator
LGAIIEVRSRRQGKEASLLILTRSIGTAVMIGDHIALKVLQVNDDKVRVGIVAPKELSVRREGRQHSATGGPC